MPSVAVTRLRTRMTDAKRLIEIHEECTGNQRGRRHGYDALNRSVIVLSVAAWEGFVEDALEGAVARIARRAVGPTTLPEHVRGTMLAHLYEKNGWSKLNDATKASLWNLTGRGWRNEYISYSRDRIKSLNTPNHKNVKKAFSSVVGLLNFSSNWGAKRWSESDYIDKLDELLILRHRIAHGSIGEETVGKTKSKAAVALVERIAGWTDHGVSTHLAGLNLLTRVSRKKE